MRKFEFGQGGRKTGGIAGSMMRRAAFFPLAALLLFSLSPHFSRAAERVVKDGDYSSELDFFLEKNGADGGRMADRLSFTSPREAWRQGKAAYDEGWYELALPALTFAASRGVLGARLKLARIYERGLGVAVDDARAFELYSQIARKHWNISSYHPAAPFIGQALASLGRYYLNGVDSLGLKPDARRAATHFSHAAQYFGNADAQYELARLYLEGRGVKKNVKRAISWLSNAARKKHAPSQALLGQILWEGELLPRRRLKALVLLTMARKNANQRDSEWIGGLYKSIFSQSDEATRNKAKTAVARWRRIYDPAARPGNGGEQSGPGVNKGNGASITIRKQVRIGIAEDGSRIMESRQTITREKPGRHGRRKKEQLSLTIRSVRPPKGKKARKGMSDEERMWMGMGNFKMIDKR